MITLSPLSQQIKWQKFATDASELRAIANSPNLFRKQRGIASPTKPLIKRVHGLFHSLWFNQPLVQLPCFQYVPPH